MHTTTLVLLGVTLLVATAQGQQGIDLSQGWHFQTGDNPAWSAPNFDDSGWQAIEVGKSWEQQGNADYDGFAWYRKHVSIPAELREQDAFRLTESLLLDLGSIDDVDETWFNGQPIGSTGTLPPDYKPAWEERRSYQVPGSVVRWGKDNVIAVRVYDGEAGGGLVGRHYRLRAAALHDVVRFEWDLQGGNGLFSDGPIAFAGSMQNDTSQLVDGDLRWTVKDDDGTTLATATKRVSLAATASTPIQHQFNPPGPGFYQVLGVLDSDQHDVEIKFSKFVGYRPEAIQASLTREADFEQFWQETLATLAKVDPQFQLERRSEFDSATHDVYEVAMRSLDDVRVKGWYERPKGGAVAPGLLRVPGYGQNMRPSGTQALIAVLSFNVRGHGNSQEDVAGQPQDFWIRGLDDKHGYYYQGAYADCVRAVDFLVSRPEVDNHRIGVTGGSQGGGLSLATAALDSRISLCAPDIPFLCDWVKYFKASHWPEMNQWIEAKSDRTWDTALSTLSYFDTLNMADKIRCPVLVGLGVQDGVCPPSTIFSVYNRLAGPKEYRAYPQMAHWVTANHVLLRDEWLARELATIRQ